jgi:phosphoribosylformylglycinamidine synthase
MVYRIYVEKKKELAHEAKSLLKDINGLLQIESVKDVRVLNRYDVDNIEEELFNKCISTVFSEPQLDDTYNELNYADGSFCFAVEYLPGQFDQRADSAAQCIQLISKADRPDVRTAKVYIIEGALSDE